MRVLIFTQAVDTTHPILGFFHGWILRFAEHSEEVYVICLWEGEHDLPENVHVYSLGKEKGVGRLVYLARFFSLIWTLRHKYDAVFVHMNQIYVILGGVLWRLWRKPVCLWYAHGSVTLSLRLAHILANTITTSTPEGFRLRSRKTHVVGQGIDTVRFAYNEPEIDEDYIRIIYVGRISPIKKCDVLIHAVEILKERGLSIRARFIGSAMGEGALAYFDTLQRLVSECGLADEVTFEGAVENEKLPAYLKEADVFANTSTTGSLDKAGMEAIASGVPVVTPNIAYEEFFGAYAARLMYENDDPRILANKIHALHRSVDRSELVEHLAQKVRSQHSLEMLIPKILNVMKQ